MGIIPSSQTSMLELSDEEKQYIQDLCIGCKPIQCQEQVGKMWMKYRNEYLKNMDDFTLKKCQAIKNSMNK